MELVLLKCDIGSRAATVLCPVCKRISRQILSASYSPNKVNVLIRLHTCPICANVYRICNSGQAERYSAIFARYNLDADAYNQSAKDDYEHKRNACAATQDHSAETSEQAHYWYCEIAFQGTDATYSYISEEGSVDLGSKVLVPFGKNNDHRVGTVKACSMLRAEEAPNPDGTKHIIRLVTEEAHSVPQSFKDIGDDGDPENDMPLDAGLRQAALEKVGERKEGSADAGGAAQAQPMRKEESLAHLAASDDFLPKTSMPGKIAYAGVEVSANEAAVVDAALERRLKGWKDKLLDISKRSKMINYRETSRATLRILEPDAAELFHKLTSSEKALTFQKPISKDADLRTYSMIALMETLSYKLHVHEGDIRTAGTIVEREKTLKNLRSKAKLALEEQGTNILYLCFGFVYWREQNRDSSPWFKAPLLMMPVTLGLKSLNAPYTLSRYDDEIEVNPTLDYLFNTEYHIDLPTFEMQNRQSFDEYFSQIEQIVDKRGWKVTREVSLGLLSFLKISMYHDLNNNRALIMNHPVLRAMAGDREAADNLPVQNGRFDFDTIKPNVWHEVVDSDSSQQEAILLSKMGASFVMQGPPGTGKSQTITNIIAEALADGKKVLFVSEKAAALQVVQKRLAEVHLDDFCLSLHSYKANKKEIIQSIGANLNLEDAYVNSSALHELTEMFHDRAFLNTYAKELHREIAPLDQSAYMAFSRISRLEKASVLEFSFENITEVTKEQYASMLYCVSAFEMALRSMDGKLSANPWFGTKAASSGQAYKTQLLRDTGNLSENLRKIAEVAGRMDSQLGMGMTKCFSALEMPLAVSTVLASRPSFMSRLWFDAELSAQDQQSISEAKEHSARLRQYREAILSEWDESVFSMNTEDIQDNFHGDFSWIYSDNAALSIQGLKAEQASAESLKRQIEVLLSVYHEGLRLLSCRLEDTADAMGMTARVLGLIAEAPCMEAAWFDVRQNVQILPLIEEAMEHSAAFHKLSAKILKHWEPTVFDIDASGMLARFKTEYVGVFHTWKPEYKEDMKTLRLHFKAVGEKIDEAAAIGLLKRLKKLNAQRAWFKDNGEMLTVALGQHYCGMSSDWNKIRAGMSKAFEIAREFPYSVVPQQSISALLRITENIQLSGEARRIAACIPTSKLGQLESDIRRCRYISAYASDCDIRQSVLPQIDAFIESCGVQSRYASMFAAARKDASLRYEDITALLSNITAVKEEQAWFAQRKSLFQNLFMEAYREEGSDWDEIFRGFETVERLTELFDGDVPEAVVSMVCDPNLISAAFLSDASELARLVRETEPKLEAFSSQFTDGDFHLKDIPAVADRYDACMNGFGELNKWLDYVETKAECDKQGLADFTAKIEELDNTIPDVQDAFERGFYVQWLNRQLDGLPAVQSFRRRVHEQRIERFVALDTKQYEISRQRIRQKIISTYPDLNRITRAGSELRILRHEMEKTRRIMPLRRLFKSIPGLLLTLKPCLMMSPLSVAYFLDANAYRFDMVIFDEASQIFPQDAIGAIFRAKQIVIAGDTKQLPPTNFFSTNTSNNADAYDGDEYEEEVYDSILEETANILPNRTLLWHYRSRHEHLIAFSNQEIYKNELITFPSSNESEPDTGVEFVYVEDGYYEKTPKNQNIPEARRIVELVKAHIEKHPDRSLGIIAFSEKQQQAISLEIQRFREKHTEYEDFFAEGKEDEFFVKNLENVQGDERDTIFFSVGYAKTREQKASGRPMDMRFGPLGSAGGERRLNVAITRAKINIKLVSSILPSDIDLSRTESEGIRMLRSYIEFAMHGEAALAAASRNSRPDDFVDSIAHFIRAQGFKVHQHIGCSGYKIDIALQHPSDTIKQYVAGIECDGFSYIAARTARDRDRLRSSVLKNMGWNLYRVWAAEWYKNPEIEGQKLVDFIRNAIAACDEKIKFLEEQKRKEEEAKRLELEKARGVREAEAQRRRREREEREAQFRAERENKRRAPAGKWTADLYTGRDAEKAAATREFPVKNSFGWAVAGVAVHHDAFGCGVIETIESGHISVRFGADVKQFHYPGAFEKGYLRKETAKEEKGLGAASGGDDGLLEDLRKKGFRCIDNRSASSILWVLYEPAKREMFEKSIAGYNVRYRFEKRGALATNHTPAWRIMFN